MNIEYGFFSPIQLESQETFFTSLTILEFHGGDWHVPFQGYKNWLKEWYTPNSNGRGILEDVFICRRDYPIGGTGFLFDPATQTYTFPQLIQESREDLGGVDMIDISGWAYSETQGRVGSYTNYELGGVENLRAGIKECQRLGIHAGLYLEGYLIDPRSEIGKTQAQNWQIITSEGNPKKWPGNQEMFMCPYVKNWQEFMSKTFLQVAQETGADALYMDQYGFANSAKSCFSADHGHKIGAHPLHGEHGMLKSVRMSLNQNDKPVALYTEQVPNDITSQYTDAAFDYSMAGKHAYHSPAKLNLFRFAFPDFKMIELFHAGIDPKGISAEDAKLCFFHGNAMWLKGRARSWYSREFREFTKKAYTLFHEYRKAFTSANCEPLIPTKQPGLYANLFSSEDENVFTLYNDRYHTLSGLLLKIPGESSHVSDLWGISNFLVTTENGKICIHGDMNPHDVACVSVVLK